LALWIHIPQKGFKLFPKIRFDVYRPIISLINYFSEFAPVKSQRQTPSKKKNKPDIFEEEHGVEKGFKGLRVQRFKVQGSIASRSIAWPLS